MALFINKVSMPSTFSGLGNARNIKEILLETDDYYDVQKPREDAKISIVITFLKRPYVLVVD